MCACRQALPEDCNQRRFGEKAAAVWGDLEEGDIEGTDLEKIAYPLLPSMCYDRMAFKGWLQRLTHEYTMYVYSLTLIFLGV